VCTGKRVVGVLKMSLISNGWGLGSAPANAAFPRYAYMRLLSLGSVADREVEVEAVNGVTRRGFIVSSAEPATSGKL
jgi:hypothetical protein